MAIYILVFFLVFFNTNFVEIVLKLGYIDGKIKN